MSCGIYKIENLINHKIYIGKSINIEKRWKDHKNSLKCEKYSNIVLYKAMNKHGIENFSFEIIELCKPNKELLAEREKYWIKYFDSYYTGYNETLGGEGTWKYDPQEIKDLWNKGFSSKEIMEKIGCSEATLQFTLKDVPTYTFKEAQKRSSQDEEYKKKRRQITMTAKNSKPVYQYSLTGEYLNEFECAADADKALGKQLSGSISAALHGKTKQCYGFLWSYEKKDHIKPYSRKGCLWFRNKETNKLFISANSAANWAGISRQTLAKACKTGNFAGEHPETKEKLTWECIDPNDYEEIF